MNANCTPPAVKDFPKDLFENYQLENGCILIHILATIYIFTAIAIICDDYFVPVIEKICLVFHVPPDIAGATFMAIATSAPELFVNIIGTFVTEGDIGLGTIVGSAVFNILAVPACCGLTLAMNGLKLHLDWWPLTRDSLIYGISVCLLIVFLENEQIEWYEAMTLVLVYVAYIIFLIFDKHIQKWVKEIIYKNCFHNPKETNNINNHQNENENNEKIIPKNVIRIKRENTELSLSKWPTETELREGNKVDTNDEIEQNESLWIWPSKIKKINQVIWILNWPINAVFFLTVPNCARLKSKKWVPVAFCMCMVWIGGLSYILSWVITVIGYTLRIPDSVMGISFLAIGAGIPEAASSIVVIKKGQGAMGISNSLGSNTFDILLCLGIPWLLKSTVVSTKKWVTINSSGLQYSTITLLVILVAFYLSLFINKFQLDKWIGLYTMIIYLLFIILATLIELNVFFIVSLPSCER